jgi:hypothetical protein
MATATGCGPIAPGPRRSERGWSSVQEAKLAKPIRRYSDGDFR